MWAFDEHRIGLKPVLRRVWAQRGERPVVPVQPRYQWSYLHGFVHPVSGRSFWWLTSWVDVEAFNLVLREFALWCGAGKDKRVLLVLDQAGWHTSAQVQLPEGVRLLLLPPYSPELQPAERLWPLSNQALCNKNFASLDQLEREQSRRCCQLMEQHNLLRRYTLFHWWPNTN